MEHTWRRLADDLGPARIHLLRDAASRLEAIVVVDNTACGPSIGGVRMAPDIGVAEVARLARAMSLKNAAAGLPHGGGKAGIVAEPGQGSAGKEDLVRAFARAIAELADYIPGPDMGTDETCMAWIHDETGRSVGLPRVLGGIPLDQVGATGYGLAVAAEVIAAAGWIRLDGARVVIQGYGSVGRHAARLLHERGAVITAIADSGGGTARSGGLDVGKLEAWKSAGHSVAGFAGGEYIGADALVSMDCDVWIPAARPDVLTAANQASLHTRVFLEGANVPATPDVEAALGARDILVVPDIIANAGGVICASVEYRGGTEAQAFALIDEKVRANTGELLRRVESDGTSPRAAAEAMAADRLREAASYRRHD